MYYMWNYIRRIIWDIFTNAQIFTLIGDLREYVYARPWCQIWENDTAFHYWNIELAYRYRDTESI